VSRNSRTPSDRTARRPLGQRGDRISTLCHFPSAYAFTYLSTARRWSFALLLLHPSARPRYSAQRLRGLRVHPIWTSDAVRTDVDPAVSGTSTNNSSHPTPRSLGVKLESSAPLTPAARIRSELVAHSGFLSQESHPARRLPYRPIPDDESAAHCGGCDGQQTRRSRCRPRATAARVTPPAQAGGQRQRRSLTTRNASHA